MSTVFIKQTHTNGFSRTWRINPSNGPQTLGSSRLAALTSLAPTAPGIEGVFEYVEQNWYWINLSAALSNPNDIRRRIDGQTKIDLKDSVVEFYFAEKPSDLHDKLETSTGASPRDNYGQASVLEIVKFGEHTLSLQTMPAGKGLSATALELKKLHGDAVSVLQRPVHVENTHAFTSVPMKNAFGKETQKNAAIAMGFFVLFLGAALFGPKSSHEAPLDAALQPRAVTLTLQQLPPKNRQAKAPEQAKKPTDKSAAGAKNFAQTLKAVSSSRLSKLLGKVALHAAVTKNVIVTRGVASIENTGQALAAVGKANKSGVDWGAETKGNGVNIATSGNGKGVGNGYGQLSSGNTGNAGVGLIEDESEISGGLDREVIAQIIKSNLGQVLYCYERQLSANPELFGKVAVKFTIDAGGTVDSQKIGDTTLRNSAVENCILKKIAGWKFPAPTGGTKVVVSYPFLFKSTN